MFGYREQTYGFFGLKTWKMPEKALNFTWRAFFTDSELLFFLDTKLVYFGNRFIFAIQNFLKT